MAWCVYECVVCVLCVLCVYSSACFLSNVVQLTWRCVFVFVICSRISSLCLPSARTTETHTHTGHTHTLLQHTPTYTQQRTAHSKMAPRAFRARLNTLTAVGPARRLPRRGINMLHKYKHKSINNFDEQQVTLALHTFWPVACGTCSSSNSGGSDSKSTICDSCCERNCALPTFRCAPQIPGSAAGAV